MIYFVYSVILSLHFCSCQSMSPSIKTSDGSTVSNELWSNESTQSANSVVANNDRKVFRPAQKGRRIAPVYFPWKVMDAPEPFVRNVLSTTENTTEAVTANVSDISQALSRFITSYVTKYNTANEDYQWTPGDTHQCLNYEECQLKLKNSQCTYKDGRRICSCSRNYIKYGNECLIKVPYGGQCNESIQCVARLSVCYQGYCECFYNDERYDEYCISDSSQRNMNQHLVWPYILPSICFLILGLMFAVVSYAIRRMKARPRTVTSSEVRQITSETCVDHVDKPPSYDEIISTSTTTLTLSVEELAEMPPPSYAAIQQGQQQTDIAS